ncbi:replicative DNA helicase [Candidatus Endolissoclinum faulkneri L5]|uniref:Replicative DNA helicase n=1 Tax=Candidatus Endolissoclinum faulkneri L5 TaxID=1401328 RepID=V9TTY2_9PROT|nr:replicative DNA helicase [Candidatus Endolissoclinum faulkneri]AHC73622.1 replicative DNA helicase [Candidatus Endolissoclinum faulkneri L5]
MSNYESSISSFPNTNPLFTDSSSKNRSSYREPPHNLEAEQALLGAILVNNRSYDKVSEFLSKEHFADPVHGRIFDACAKLINRGQIATPITLKCMFDQDEALSTVGGAQYLVKLAASVVTVINASDYGREIRECYLRRELIDIGEVMVNEAFDRDIDIPAHELIDNIENQLFTLAETGANTNRMKELKLALLESVAQIEAAYRREGGIAGYSTGFIDIDNLLGGLHASDLLILAARPAMGKSTLASNIAFHISTSLMDDPDIPAKPVAFFSLEMSAEQLATRILSERTGIASDKLRRGQLNNEDFQKLVTESEYLERAPMFIDDTPAIPIHTMRTRARRLKRQLGLSLIVVDYLQLMRPAQARGGRIDNRVQEISSISQGLKAIAKELDVPVLAISQLSRAVEQREDKRPILADLRESGSIEQDADIVMFIYREEYYLQKSEPIQRIEEDAKKFHERYDQWKERCKKAHGRAEIIISKQRHGPTGVVKLNFDGSTTKFTNYAAENYIPEQY